MTDLIFEQNFVEKALSNGFKCNQKNFRPRDNWFGVSIYNPMAVLQRGEKKIALALNCGTSTVKVITDVILNTSATYCEIAPKHILFRDNDSVIYESLYGVVPDDDIINEFIGFNGKT